MSELYAAALKHSVLSKQDEYALCARYGKLRDKHGAEHPKALAVRNQLVRANLRMVAKLAKRYHRLPFEDLMGEGVKGLIIGVERFEPERGWRLGTFATYWVRHSLQRACQDLADIVRVPVHKQEKLRNGSEAVDGVRMLESKAFSLDARLSDDPGSGTLYDLLPTGAAPVTDALDECRVASDVWRAVLTTLNAREREIITRRYLNGADETLQEVGRHVGGVSRERVRQLQALAFEKLRHALAQYEDASHGAER